MNPINVEKLVNDRYKEVLGGMSVKFDIHIWWYEMALQILDVKSPMSMGLSANEYKDMVVVLRNHEILDCYTFAGLNNEIEQAEPRLFGMDKYDYAGSMELCEELAAKWKDQCGEIKEKIVDQVLKEFSNIKPGKNNDQLPIHN